MRNFTLFVILMYLYLNSQEIVAQSTTRLDPSSQIEGTYKVVQMTAFTPGKPPKMFRLDQPGNKISAVITAKRKSQRYVILVFSQFQNSTQMMSFSYGDAYLRSTLKGYDLAIDGDKIGETDGHHLTIDISAADKKRGNSTRSLIVCKRSQ